MTEQLSVHQDSGADFLGAVIASLPISLAFGGPDADLHAVTGTPGWTSRAVKAIDNGARGIVIINPVAEDTRPLEGKVVAAQVPVVIDYPAASNTAVAEGAAEFLAAAPGAALFNALVSVRSSPELQQAELDLVAVAERLVGPLKDLRTLRSSNLGFSIAATLPSNGAPATLSGTVSLATPYRIRATLITTDGAVEIQLPEPATARPAEVTVTGAGGMTLFPTVFESAHRSTWRRLHRLVLAGELPADLADFNHLTTLLA